MKNIGWMSLAFLVGCSSAEKKFSYELEAAHCESALDNIPENSTGAKLISRTKNASGIALSYTITGAAYTGEVLLDVVGGTVMFVALCSPAIAMVAAATYQSNSGTSFPADAQLCFPGKLDALFAPPLGRNTFDASKNLRCPELVGMSESIRKVATCFSRRKKDQDLEKAEHALIAMQQSPKFFECLPQDEKNKINKDIDEINSKKQKL